MERIRLATIWVLLGAIHMKEHLLKTVVKEVAKGPK